MAARSDTTGMAGVLLVVLASTLAASTPSAPAPPAAVPQPEIAAWLDTTARPLVVTPSEADAARSVGTLRKVDDHPLYAMTYYGPAPRLAGVPSDRPHGQTMPAGRAPFGCTVVVAAGDAASPVFGRNFDWAYNPALVLLANPTDAYRSVSVVDLSYLGLDASRVADLDRSDDAAVRAALLRAVTLPFDGMNEHGLVIGMAAVDQARAELRPGRPAVGSVGVMRLVLDRARTVDDAVALLGSYNIDFSGGPGLHYIVADASGASAVVEFVDGRLRVLPRPAGDRWQVIENFHLATAEEPARLGYQRYRTAVQRLAGAAGRLSADDTLALLAAVAQPHTQWSAVYQPRERSVRLATGKRFERVHTFSLGA